MKELTIRTSKRTEFVDITGQVQDFISETNAQTGMVTAFVPHTTAGITINENADPDVMTDVDAILERMVPWRGKYRHAEGNTAAHVKASLVGSSVNIIVSGSRLKLGTWQGIYFCEFDGPRTRRIWLHAG